MRRLTTPPCGRSRRPNCRLLSDERNARSGRATWPADTPGGQWTRLGRRTRTCSEGHEPACRIASCGCPKDGRGALGRGDQFITRLSLVVLPYRPRLAEPIGRWTKTLSDPVAVVPVVVARLADRAHSIRRSMEKVRRRKTLARAFPEGLCKTLHSAFCQKGWTDPRQGVCFNARSEGRGA